MSNRQKRWTKVVSASQRHRLNAYAEALTRTGMPEREVARAYFYAERYGLEALSGDGDQCAIFGEPNCGDWNCVRPDHQQLEFE